MSYVWEEPEHIRQSRELAIRFNEVSGNAGLQKFVSNFQSALDAAVPPSSIAGMSAGLQSISSNMRNTKIQSQLGTLVIGQTTIPAALQMSEALKSA